MNWWQTHKGQAFMLDEWEVHLCAIIPSFPNKLFIQIFSNITLFRSITMLCGSNNILQNIPHIQNECWEYSTTSSEPKFQSNFDCNGKLWFTCFWHLLCTTFAGWSSGWRENLTSWSRNYCSWNSGHDARRETSYQALQKIPSILVWSNSVVYSLNEAQLRQRSKKILKVSQTH